MKGTYDNWFKKYHIRERMKLGTKAETLSNLRNKLDMATVLPQISFTAYQWKTNKEKIVEDIVQSMWLDKGCIVRSSALGEDSYNSSMAGKYDSVLGVISIDELYAAVEKVIASYGTAEPEDQVLVQPMLQNIVLSGVAFTMEPTTGGNYYVINYDDASQSTSSITAGNALNQNTIYVFKSAYESVRDQRIKYLCETLTVLEKLFGQPNLDVEFAYDDNNMLYIMQVRALIVNAAGGDVAQQEEILGCISRKVREENCHKPFLFGKRTIWGVMPDWNPAEMIGIRPKPLALSLYKEIITDNIWAYQRDTYGYRNLRSFPLLKDFFGLPYIDTRVSFNSFIPATLREEIGEKLVNYYLDMLEAHPEKHDKIEFEVAFTCYTFDLEERISLLRQYEFKDEEIKEIVESLRGMTRRIIDNEDGLWKKDYQKIIILQERYETVVSSDLDLISKIYWLLEDCKRYGTLPFAGLARAGFIAVELLKSMVRTGLMSEEEHQQFMGDLNTVSSMMAKDKVNLSRDAFVKKYGHLRPGTYDIVSKRYDEAIETYFVWGKPQSQDGENEKKFKLSLKQLEHIDLVVKEAGLADSVLDFFHFIQTAIEGREFAKFVFTRSLSKTLSLIEELGQVYGISRVDLAYINVHDVQGLYSSCVNVSGTLKDSISHGKKAYEITKQICLPSLICHETEVFQFYSMKTIPNYVTLKQVIGEVICIDGREIDVSDVEGKIVLMRSADPGYDWIFSRKIIGFVTEYGGANSHMAIRAGELQIPAAIGVGQKLFECIRKAHLLELDALGKRLQIIR